MEESKNPILVFSSWLEGKPQKTRTLKKRVTIGSVESADVQLNHPSVSPIHAIVEITKNKNTSEIKIFDLASEGGVTINGKKEIKATLKPGDEVQIGELKIEIAFSDQVDSKSDEPPVLVDPTEVKSFILEDETETEKIFDYQPVKNKALEVVMSWRGIILSIQHFVNDKEVTVGTSRKCHFPVPAELSRKSFSLFKKSEEGYQLLLDPAIKGVFQSGGQLKTAKEMESSLISKKSKEGFKFGANDYAKLTVGEVDFYVSYTEPPPNLKLRRWFEKDPILHRSLGGSLAVSIALIVTFLNLKVTQEIRMEELPDRIVKILFHPEKYAPQKGTSGRPEISSPSKKSVLDLRKKHIRTGKSGEFRGQTQAKQKEQKIAQEKGKEGAGRRAKGKKGKRGSRLTKRKGVPQTQAQRPSGIKGTGRGGGKSKVGGEGNVEALKGAEKQIQKMLGTTLAKLGKSGEKLKGYSGFDTEGTEGAALTGGDIGGGGDSDQLGGLSDKGHGGGRIGTGLGARGTGKNIVGGKTRLMIRTGGAEEAVVMGAIDADAVTAALMAHKDEFRFCYEKEINAGQPNLAGRVTTSFVIGSVGRVRKAGIQSTSLNNRNTERCILRVIRRIDFPRPRGGGIVQVTFPFRFRPITN